MCFARTLLVPVFLLGGLMELGVGSTQIRLPAIRIWWRLGIDPDGAGVG